MRSYKNKTVTKVADAEFEYLTGRLLDPCGEFTIWGESILSAYKRVSKLNIFPVLTHVKNCEFVVIGTKIFNQVSAEKAKNIHLVMTARDLFRCKRMPSSFSYDLKSYGEIYSVIVSRNKNAYDACFKRIKFFLSKINAITLVVNSTVDPINRLWVLVAKNLGLNVICVQHGLFGERIPSYVLEEDIVDKYVAFDIGQAKIISRNIPMKKIVLLGASDNFEWTPPLRKLKLCFVGEDWEKYGLLDIKVKILNTYKSLAVKLRKNISVEIYYKPHPNEDLFLDIFNYSKLTNDVQNPDVFVGFSSTLLKQMASNKKLAVQINDSKITSDDYEKLGYCLSIINDGYLYDNLIKLLNKSSYVPYIKNRSIDQCLSW